LNTIQALEEKADREIGGVPVEKPKAAAAPAAPAGEHASASQLEALRKRFSKE
jgi:hypothetical protein